MNKRGLSPVIATVLLVGMVIVLGVIIFIWALQFQGENIQKNDRAIEQSCPDVAFKAEAYGGDLHIENIGRVPIHGVEISKSGLFGEVSNVETFDGVYISNGETTSVDLPNNIEERDSIKVIPILLGETENYQKSRPCGEEFGKEVVVGS